MTEELTIGEVARMTGLRTSAIRYYEDIDVLPEPEREHGHRRYTRRVLQQLAVIQLARQSGFTMAEIRTLMTGFEEQAPVGVRWRSLAEQKLAEIEAQMARIQTMKRILEEGIRCECPSLDECFPME